MATRENAFLEASKCLRESQAKRLEDREKRIQENVNKRDDFMNTYYSIKESREVKERRHAQLLEAARNNALSTALKGIYITALEAHTLTDNGIILAENMVDNWIKEKGGANKIFNECKNNTYFLARLSQIVEDAAEEEVKEIEKDPEDEKLEDSETEKKETKESENKDHKSEDSKEENNEKVEEPKEESENKEDNPLNVTDFEDEDKEEEPLGNDGDPTDDQTDAAEEIIDDIEIDDTPVSVDGDGVENQGKVFDELEKEEDVRKAIELIRQRVADAEEAFIKRNAEDKKQIDELLAKISDNVKTVEDLSDDSDESKVAQESARMNRRKIQEITENRTLTILEKMTRNLSKGIVKDEVLREQYITENGDLDTHLVVESAKVMYGFLETISTLQLEKVDAAYIAKVLEEM